MNTLTKHYNGTLWRACPAMSGNNSFFHSAFGVKMEEDAAYFDKHAKFRRVRWAGFLIYFENERMPRSLADVLRRCLSAHDIYQHASIDDEDTLGRYVTDIMTGARPVNKEELHILATLENVQIVVLPNGEQDRAVVVKPNPDILGSYRNVPGNVNKVVLCLEGDTFSRLEPTNEDTDSTLSQALSKTKRTDRYKKSRGSAGSKGVEYQVNLLTMVMLQALRSTLPQWKLSTENEEAGKFDDIVLEWSQGTVLIQSKHKENDRERITIAKLTSTNSRNDDFSLPKYFLWFQMVKTTFNVKNVIICTNASVHEEALDYLDRHDATSESLLYHQDGKCSFHTLKNGVIKELKEKTMLYYHLNFTDKGIADSVITEGNLEVFLEVLQLYFNYPSIKRLENIIEHSLSTIKPCSNPQGKILHLEMYTKVKDWFQNYDGIYLTSTNTEVKFLEIWMDKYYHNLEHYNVSFRRNLDLDLYGLQQIFYVASPLRNLLQVIRIYQSIRGARTRTMTINPDDDVDIQRLKVQTFIENTRYVYLVIIRPKAVEESRSLDIYGRLKETLTQREYKKIILIAEDNALLQRIGLDDYFPIDASVAFRDLSSVCQDRLLREPNIVFQGAKVSLEEILKTQSVDYSKILNQEIMEMLIVGEGVKVGAPLVDLNDNVRRHYVSRIFVREVSKMEEMEFETSSSEEVSDLSKKLAQDQRGIENNGSEDEESNNEMEKEMFSEHMIYDVDEKLVIVADHAGMGKTTVLTKLAVIIKESNPDLWVIRIELNDYTKIFSECLAEGKESINITELLGSKPETKFTNYLEESVFTIDRKVVMMLDGIDEISPDYTNLVLGLVKRCHEDSNFSKIFVTTRSHMAAELEAVFKVKSFVLQPFTEQNQLNFLTSYWLHNLELRDDANKERCKHFAQQFMKKISWTNLDSNGDSNFASIPLHISMAAEIFQERARLDESMNWGGCKEYILGDEVDPSFTHTMNLRILYDLFLKRKRDIFIDKGNPTGNPTAKEALAREFADCLLYHRSLALEVILGEDKLLHFPEYQRRDENTENNLLKIGIVQQLGGKFHFVHRTFADYFLAEILQAELRRDRGVEFHALFLDTILLEPQYNTTRVFLDSFIRKTVDSWPCDIFREYQSLKKKSSSKQLKSQSKLLHVLAEEGCLAILQLVLKCIGSKNVNNVEIRIKDSYTIKPSVSGNTLKVLQHLTEQAGMNVKDENGWTPLHCAARKGDIEMIKYLIARDADVDSRNDHGDTIIQVATRYGLFNTVQCLAVEYGMDVNVSDNKGYTVLHIASKNGHLDVARLLLALGADSTATTKDGYTALHLAARFGHVNTVKFLVESGIDYTVTNNDGRTLLNSASARGHLETVKYLLELGLDYEIKCKFGNTPLQVAAYFGRLETVQYLVERGARFDVNDKKGRTPLHSASRNGHLKTVHFLLQLGVDPDVRDKDGYTALHFAASFGHLDIVQLFVERGLNFNVTNNNGDTVLHSASANGNLEIVKYLLELGIDSSIKNRDGCTALQVAVNFNRLQIVKYLAENGANLDVTTKGQSLLYSASSKGHLAILKFLVESCNPVSKSTKPSRTPLHAAGANGHLEAAKLLLELDVDTEASDRYGFTPLHFAVRSGHLDVVKLFVGHGLDFNVTNSNGDTLLHSASENGHIGVVKYLLELGIDPTTKNNHGDSVLHMGAYFGRLDVVKLFAELGHDINVTNSIGYTPLHSACSKGHLGIIKFLLHLDVDYNARDHKGYTALHAAARFNQLDAIKLLVGHGFNYKVTNYEGRTLLHSASATGHLQTVKYVQELGMDINAKDIHGYTAMQTGVFFGRKKVYDFFIKCGQDCNVKDPQGRTLLQTACVKGHLSTIKYFLEHGVDCRSRDVHGYTLLHLAAFYGHRDIVQFLVEYGLDLDDVNDFGHTLLHSACLRGHFGTVKYLLGLGVASDVKDEAGYTPLHLAAGHGHLDVVKFLVDSGVDVNVKDNSGNTVLDSASANGRLEVVHFLQELI